MPATPDVGISDPGAADAGISDEELAAEAMAADLDVDVDPGAVPFGWPYDQAAGLLPAWYMPSATRSGGRRRPVVVGSIIVLALVAVNAVGLCVTSGFLEIAW